MEVIYSIEFDEFNNDIKIEKELNEEIRLYKLFNNLQDEYIKEYKFIDTISTSPIFAINGDENQKDILKKIKKIRVDDNLEIKKAEAIVFNNNEDIIDILQALKIQLLGNQEKRYNYIYDKVCDYLDDEFVCKNICDFEDDRCIAKRGYDVTCGCCRHYKNKKFNLFSNKLVQCEYLINKQCSAKCITCKLFTCDYVVKTKGIKFRIKKIFLLDYYFNWIQKIILKTSFFTPKEQIIKKLLTWGRF